MARVKFDTLFQRNQDSSLEPTREIRISGTTIRPGFRFNNVTFGGVNLSSEEFLNHDFEVTFDGDTTIITGIYKDD